MATPCPNIPINTLVLDASVAINLLGSNKAALVLDAIGIDVFIEETTLSEVKKTKYPQSKDENTLQGLLDQRILKVSTIPEDDETFWNLLGAKPPDDLDDGEAAAIALARLMS